MSQEELVGLLKNKGLSCSHQRLVMLEYLKQNKSHPTVDTIYSDLKASGSIPTLSRATVYNNIRAFVDAGLLDEIEIGDHERRYDPDTHEHSHFYCEECGKILNLELPEKLQDELFKNFNAELPGSILKKSYVNYVGVCKDCQDRLKKS